MVMPSNAKLLFQKSHQDTVAMKQYFVHMMTDASRTLYTGVTNNLERRLYEHKHKLVYYETTPNVHAAIAREKPLKDWLRAKKIALIESANPNGADLSADWQEM